MIARKTQKIIYNIVIICLLIGGVTYVCSRFIHLGNIEYTDNAQVKQHITPINTRVPGFIKKIYFDEYQQVRKGDTLLIIEDAEFRLRVAQAEADLKFSKAKIAAMQAEELEGNMHRSEDVAAMTEDLIFAIRSGLLALPGRLAVMVSPIISVPECADAIRKEIYHLMEELSRYRYDPEEYARRVRERMDWSTSPTGDDNDE